MGKTRKKRDRKALPVTEAAASGYTKRISVLEESSNDESREELLQRIIRQLQDASPESQECGLQSFAVLISSLNASSSPAGAGAASSKLDLPSVLEHKLVRLVGPLMASPSSSPSIVHSAAGALRNLSLVSADACDEMIKQDVMTPLCALLANTFGSGWTPAKKERATTTKLKMKGGIDTKAEIFVEAVNLLWNLCEANASAMATFNRENLCDLLLTHLNADRFGHEIRLPVMQCLYTASEDNPEAQEKIRGKTVEFEAIMGAQDASSPQELYLQILSVGVVINAADSATEELSEATWRLVVSIVAKLMDVDQRKMACDFTSACPISNGNGEETPMDEETTESEKLDAMRTDLNSTILAQQTAIEILTNILCGADDSDEEGWDFDSEGGMSDDGISENGSGASVGCSESALRSLPTFIVEALESGRVVQNLLAKANLPPENVCQILRESAGADGRMLMRMLNTLRTRAFLCLNNLVGSLGIDDLGGADRLFHTWTELGKLCLESGPAAAAEGAAGAELKESASSAMRAIVHKLAENENVESASAPFAAVTKEDLAKMLEFGASSEDPAVRTNVVNMAGNIGVMTVSSSGSEAAAEAVTQFLLEAAARDASLRVVGEALDKIFDMYAEDSTDALCEKVGVVGKLKQLRTGLKIKMQKQSKKGEDSSMMKQTKVNLARFIKYKAQRGID